MNAVIRQLIEQRIEQLDNARNYSAERLATTQQEADTAAAALALVQTEHDAIVTEMDQLLAELDSHNADSN